MSTHIEQVKAVADTASVAVVLGALASWLPPLAALASLIWAGIRIWETDTVQALVKRRKDPDNGEGTQ